MQDTESSSIEECPSCGTAIDATGAEPLMRLNCPVCGAHFTIGRFMGHYELLEEVGRGGMGVVYKALDTNLGRHVALKVLRKDNSENEELMKQLETEAAITASINHPHVVRVFSTGTAEGRFYIAMELVDKGTLDDLIELQGTVAEAQVLDVAIQISQGLRAAYQHGLIHRDVKPGNILFSDSKTAKIVDFGLATLEQAAVSTGEIWGTPYYVAPEKLDQKPEDFRSDMYSLGATLFHALAGRPPFEAADATLVALKHLKSEAVSLQAFAPHVSGSTAYVINRTLSKDPDKRYQSYDEFIEHLEYARREFAENANKPKVKQRLAMENEKDQRLWGLITFAMLGLLVAAGVGAFFFMPKKEKTRAQNPVEVAAPTPGAAPRTAQGRAFEAARDALITEDLDAAVKRFRAVATDPTTPPPFAHWAYVHEGLAHLLAGRTSEAQQAFEALRNLGAPAGEGAKYAKFFATIAEKAQSTEIIPAGATRDFDSTDATPLGSLILGLKNWELGAFDHATPLIRGYHAAPPGKDLPWIADYKPLISPYVADLAAFRGAVEMARGAKTLEDRKAALDAATNARQGLSVKSQSSKMAATLDSLITDLRFKTGEAPVVAAPSREVQQASFDRAMGRVNELAENWQFADARKEMEGVAVSEPSLVAKRDLLVTKLGWLADAKKDLITLAPAASRTSKFSKRSGEAVGILSGAFEDGVQTADAKVPWKEIAPGELVSALGASATITQNRERLWSAGVLGAWAGASEAAIQNLVAAARGHRMYLDALASVWPGLRIQGENFALRKAARASHVTKLDEAAEKAIDGNPATSWASDKAGVKTLQLDLGAPRVITRWIVKHARSTGAPAEANAASFNLEASLDGKKWAELDTVTKNVADVTNRTILPTQARYFRLNVQEPNVARIAELELYGGSVDAQAKNTFLDPNAAPIVPSIASYGIALARPDQLGTMDVDVTTGTWTMTMASRDIWDLGDNFVFVHQTLEGDGEIMMHVASIEGVDPYTKLGVMFREELTSGSRYMMTLMTFENGYSSQKRTEPRGMSHSEKQPSPVPGWVKVVRTGNTFTSFISPNGTDWQQLGEPANLKVPAKMFVGVAMTSHKEDKKAKLGFSNVRITGKTGN